MRYPRLKPISRYDCDDLRHARPGRQLNNYLLTDQPEILGAQNFLHGPLEQRLRQLTPTDEGQATESPWFVLPGESSPVAYVPLKTGDRARNIEAFVRTCVNRPQVFFRVDGRVVAKRRIPERLSLELPAGQHRVEVLVYDDRNRFVQKRSVTLKGGASSPAPPRPDRSIAP